MVRIAIAGGTGGLGRTLLDELSRGNEVGNYGERLFSSCFVCRRHVLSGTEVE